MILMFEHYTPGDVTRLAELDATYKANVESGLFDQINPLTSNSEDKRLRFGQVFRMAAERWPGQVCVLANADIQFDTTGRMIPAVVNDTRLVALTRWESKATPRMIGHVRDARFYSGSQDVWAWIGGELVGVGDSVALGYVGCDQAICGEAMNAGYSVVNPALSIKTWHNHSGGERPPSGPASYGTYAYPELTTVALTGSIVYHKWPLEKPARER